MCDDTEYIVSRQSEEQTSLRAYRQSRNLLLMVQNIIRGSIAIDCRDLFNCL